MYNINQLSIYSKKYKKLPSLGTLGQTTIQIHNNSLQQQPYSTQNMPKQPDSLEKRINNLEGNLKMIEKRYKSNLKQGFDHKIKSYRLQAVIQRKYIQKTIQATKQELQLEQLKVKVQRAQKIRSEQFSRMNSLMQRKKQYQDYIRAKSISEKKQMKQKLRDQFMKLQANNKQTHDNIMLQLRSKGKKKKYLDKIRDEKNKKQINHTKRQIIHAIVNNQDKLKDLKSTIEEMSEKVGNQGDISQFKNPFVTI